MILRTPAARRPGFTLVEVLVASALCILIMVIITEAFSAGMSTFSHMKSLGDLQSRLRSAGDIVRSDLQGVHLEDSEGRPMRVSRVRLDRCNIDNPDSFRGVLPKKGFFRVTQESPIEPRVVDYALPASPKLFTAAYQAEGTDADGLPSSRATNHVLHMTVRRPNEPFLANVPDIGATAPTVSPWPAPTNPTTPVQKKDFLGSHLTNMIPGYTTTYAGEWAEVSYFIDYTNQTGTTPTGQPTYPLIRRVRMLTDRPTGLDWGSAIAGSISGGPPGQLSNYQGMSHSALGTYSLNDAASVANPANRLGWITGTRTPAEFAALGNPILAQWQPFAVLAAHRDLTPPVSSRPALFGDDIVMTDVTSFEIKLDYDQNTIVPTTASQGYTTVRTNTNPGEPPYFDLPVPSPAVATAAGQVGFTTPLNTVNRRVFDTWYDNGQLIDHTGATPFKIPQWAWNTADTNAPEATRLPLFIQVKSIQIKMRAYDPKNKLSRQITLVSDL